MVKENEKKSEEEKSLQDVLFKRGMDRRSFLGKTTKMAGVALGATLVGSFNELPVSAVSSSSVLSSNGNKPELIFPVISDVHIYSDNHKNLEKFRTTLKQLNQVAPNQDAFVVVGDLTEYGDAAQYDRFMSVYDSGKQPQVVSMMAMGNHDYWNGLSEADAQTLFLNKIGMETIYFHKKIKGYHFIILSTEDGLTEGTFSVKQIKWLEEQLKEAHADDSKKPIFVFHHQPIKGTVYGSEWGFSKNRDLFYDTLKPYPQVISFSGHTHYPLDDPRIIHQEDFTSIGTSTGAYLWMDAGRIQGEVPEGADFLNQALIVEVYHNKVLLKRRDIHNNDWTGEPFEISFPANKENFKYTEKRRNKQLPHFTNNSMISIVHDQTTAVSLAIMLTQAKDDFLVHDYKIVVKHSDHDKVEKELLAFSEYYKDPIPNPLMLPIDGLVPNTLYEIEVFALDAYGNESKDSLKVLGKTLDGVLENVTITLSKTNLNGVKEPVEVTVEHVRAPKSDWIGLYEVNENPGNIASIWWMYTQVTEATVKFTYDPSENFHPDRYKEGSTYKFVYFYGSGYDVVASTTFTVGNEG